MKTKKQYNKPQITQVRLVIQSPVLANCNSVNDINPDLVRCNDAGTLCSDTNPPA